MGGDDVLVLWVRAYEPEQAALGGWVQEGMRLVDEEQTRSGGGQDRYSQHQHLLNPSTTLFQRYSQFLWPLPIDDVDGHDGGRTGCPNVDMVDFWKRRPHERLQLAEYGALAIVVERRRNGRQIRAIWLELVDDVVLHWLSACTTGLNVVRGQDIVADEGHPLLCKRLPIATSWRVQVPPPDRLPMMARSINNGRPDAEASVGDV